MDEEDASDHTRRCLARALAEVGRHPDPERARALDRLRQDFVGLRGAMLASRLDPASAQRWVRELGAAERLLRDLTGDPGAETGGGSPEQPGPGPRAPAQPSASASSGPRARA